jgi:hypothetical protein
MQEIDQALFNFSPRAGLAVAVMVGFLVFAVALDLTWAARARAGARPRAGTAGAARIENGHEQVVWPGPKTCVKARPESPLRIRS